MCLPVGFKWLICSSSGLFRKTAARCLQMVATLNAFSLRTCHKIFIWPRSAASLKHLLVLLRVINVHVTCGHPICDCMVL
jgi:hypothetical protein